MVEGSEQICYSIAAQRLIDCVPATEPGWDPRPRPAEEVLVKTGQTPPDA
jgi:putative component of membrane protein insertase Oxa1/YidC/SpoIIIJ protein YidD